MSVVKSRVCFPTTTFVLPWYWPCKLVNPGTLRQRLHELCISKYRESYRYSRYIGRQGLEVVERSGGVPNHKVDRDEETPKDDAETAADDGEENIFLEEDWIPRRRLTGVIYARTNHNACNWKNFTKTEIVFTSNDGNILIYSITLHAKWWSLVFTIGWNETSFVEEMQSNFRGEVRLVQERFEQIGSCWRRPTIPVESE